MVVLYKGAQSKNDTMNQSIITANSGLLLLGNEYVMRLKSHIQSSRQTAKI